MILVLAWRSIERVTKAFVEIVGEVSELRRDAQRRHPNLIDG